MIDLCGMLQELKFCFLGENIDKLDKGDLEMDKNNDQYYDVSDYLKQIDKFMTTFDSYLTTKMYSDKDNNYTLVDDIKKIREQYNYNLIDFYQKEQILPVIFEFHYLKWYECDKIKSKSFFDIS